MALIVRLVRVAVLRVRLVAEGLAAGIGLTLRLLGTSGDAKARLTAVLGDPAAQRQVFAALRGLAPNLVIRKTLVTAYPSHGTAIVSRAADVREVLDRQDDFAVVYEPKMRKITGGANFFLGMQDGDDYQRDTSVMRLAARREDVAEIIVPLARSEAAHILADHPREIDLPQHLTTVIPTLMVQRYFGVGTASVADLTTWATAMFWYLFVDLAGDPAIEARALDGAAQCLVALEAAIAATEADPHGPVTVIRRALTLRDAGTAGFAGHVVRDNMIGLVIGAIPTISKACVQAIDGLLDRPDALAQAQAAAARGDEGEVGRHVFEALRFNPVNPVIYRRATADTVIAAGTARACKVKAGTMVLASNLSAMFDPAVVAHPGQFRVDRPWGIYNLWGYGLHRCFGDAINHAIIPALLTPLLAGPPLRRAAGAAGYPDKATPFPQHFSVVR